MNTEKKYGVLLTNRDGDPNERWMSDRNHGVDVWSGSFEEASYAAASRRDLYPHVIYEVKEIPDERNH